MAAYPDYWVAEEAALITPFTWAQRSHEMSNGNNPKGKVVKGQFQTRPNPFKNTPQNQGNAPELASNTFLGQAIDAAMRQGCAVLLGHTRDGGALCITILDGDDRHRTYATNGDELDQAVASMIEMYKDGI